MSVGHDVYGVTVSVDRRSGPPRRTVRSRRHARQRVGRCCLVAFCLVAAQSAARLDAQLPESTLSVRRDGTVQVWWRSSAAPDRWPAAMATVTQAVRWRTLQRGLEWGQLDLAGDGVASKVAVILARLDPARFRLDLDTRHAWGVGGAWTIDRAGTVTLALNAGQFQGSAPWGWVVHRGEELQPPGIGPLSAALVLHCDGRVALLTPDEMVTARSGGRVVEAIQSYPAVLVGDGEVPEQLRGRNRGVDLDHRDARLGACVLRDGSLLFALTRFLSPESPLSRLPFGPTVPEMAAIMGALGCRRAVLLDGGLSAQMAFGESVDEPMRWPGLRAVPLGLTVRPR